MTAQEYIGSLFDLTGHIGIITGASRGIGLGEVEALCNAGAEIYNFDLGEPAEEDLPSTFVRRDLLHTILCSVMEYEAMEKHIREIAERHGHIDFLINNAGMTFKSRAEEFPVNRLDMIMELNLKAPFMIARICYPYLKESPFIGRVITISSMASYMGFSGVLPYDMTKSGVMGLTRGLAEEWKDDNILVNSVSPGWVLTKMNEEMFSKNPDRKAAAASKPMLARFAKPVEIGYMILFLLSQASNYLTGQDFSVDGGARSHGF